MQGHLPLLTTVDLGLEFEHLTADAAADNAGLDALWPALSAAELTGLQALLRPCAALDVAERYVSAEAMADELRAWLALLPTPAAAVPRGSVIASGVDDVLALRPLLPPAALRSFGPAETTDWFTALGRCWRRVLGI